MGDMSERLRPAATGGIPSKLEATIIEPQVKPGSGRGSGVRNPGTGTSFTPDSQPQPHKSHRVRNWIMAATASLGGTAAFIATRGGNENPPTSTAVVTTVDVKPTNPGDPVTTTVGESTTTIRETTTTQESKPTDVVEHREGYDVLRNGGLLYEVPHLTIGGQEFDTSWFGGVELHATYKDVTMGLNQDSQGLSAPQTLLETALWAFAYQDSRFRNPDNTVNFDKYLQYLKENNGIDPEVFFPSATPISAEPSDPISVNLNLPIVITNAGISSVENSQPKEIFYINPSQSGDIQEGFGITPDGQLVFSVNMVDRNNKADPLPMGARDTGSLLNLSYGAYMADLANITSPASSPQEQLVGPYLQFLNPIMISKVPNKYAVPDITKFIFLDPIKGKAGDRIFVEL